MTVLDAVEKVLAEARSPLHYVEITNRMIGGGFWQTDGKTPAGTVISRLSTDIVKNGDRSRFVRTERGVFALRDTSFEKVGHGIKGTQQTTPLSGAKKKPQGSAVSGNENKMTLADAAEFVLDKHSNRQPLHYQQITEKALELGLTVTGGQTPGNSFFAAMITDNKRRKKRGEVPRFDKQGKGYIGLTKWVDRGVVDLIEKQNDEVRKKLHERLFAMDPTQFEALIGRLLVAIGFEDVSVTSKSGDGGIDVRGTLVVGDVVRTRMAVQVKRWKKANNILAPTVQQVRGSLSSHEQGLIITTSDFSKGAIEEARDPYKSPVGLMNGDQLVRLLVENDIGVSRANYDLIELGTFEEE
jgi:restriction system protein